MSAWADRLGASVAELIDAGRWSRGRALARTGSVLSMTVEPGRVAGEVQGSEVRPYRATFSLAPLRDADAARVHGLLATEPALLGALVAGELPARLDDDSLGLFPRFADELDFECSCPDWGWPCKHAAALVHVFLDAIAAQPQTLLTLRGVGVESLLGTVAAAVDAEPALAESLTDYFEPRGELTVPDARPRPVLDELDAGLLGAALRTGGVSSEAAEAARAWLAEVYRRLA